MLLQFRHTHSQSLLQILGDLGEFRHVFIKSLRMLARDGLEHSREACVFPERVTIQAFHVRAICSFVSSLGRVKRR